MKNAWTEEIDRLRTENAQLKQSRCVVLQSTKDGVWAHFRVSKGYAYSLNLDCEKLGRRFATEYREYLAREQAARQDARLAPVHADVPSCAPIMTPASAAPQTERVCPECKGLGGWHYANCSHFGEHYTITPIQKTAAAQEVSQSRTNGQIDSQSVSSLPPASAVASPRIDAEEPMELLASKLIDVLVADKGKQIPWAKCIGQQAPLRHAEEVICKLRLDIVTEGRALLAQREHETVIGVIKMLELIAATGGSAVHYIEMIRALLPNTGGSTLSGSRGAQTARRKDQQAAEADASAPLANHMGLVSAVEETPK